MKALFAIITATLLSAAAMAGDPAKDTTAATFDSLDKNADQQISRTEAAYMEIGRASCRERV